MTKLNQKLNGFTLLEVVIFTGIVAVFFVSAASVISVSLKNMKFNEHKILATHYAQEAVEWVGGQREVDWVTFLNKSSVAGTTYCLNELDFESSGNCGENSYSLGEPSQFKRELVLKRLSDIQVQVGVRVFWREGGPADPRSVPIDTVFSLLE